MDSNLIDLYAYRTDRNTPEFLLLKRSSNKIYAGQWRMIGGKVREGENSASAAKRELHEETGAHPLTFWCVPTINHFYEYSTDTVHLIPPFAAEIDGRQEIKLDDEHTEIIWIQASDIEAYVHWPEQVRIITMIDKLIKNNRILPDWIIPAKHT